jgi:hypothetical protein
MQKSGVIIGVLLLFIINLVSLVSSAPPLVTILNFDNGYEIGISPTGFIKQNQDYQLNFFVYNKSNGIHLTNTTLSCQFYLANSTGNVLVYQNTTYFLDGHWGINILGGNFSYSEVYPFGIKCIDNSFGGATISYFDVTKTGRELTQPEAIIYIILTLGIFLIFALSFYIMLTIPYSNEANEKGAVIKITKAKYFKLLLIGVTYALFVWLLNILIGVSDNFVSLSLYYGFVSFLFTIFLNLTIPVFAVIFVIGLFEIIRDANIYQEIKRLGSALR